jgi:hypothetical protein
MNSAARMGTRFSASDKRVALKCSLFSSKNLTPLISPTRTQVTPGMQLHKG